MELQITWWARYYITTPPARRSLELPGIRGRGASDWIIIIIINIIIIAFWGNYSMFAVQWLQSAFLTMCVGFFHLHYNMKQKEQFWWTVVLLLRIQSFKTLPAQLLLPLLSRAGAPVDMADIVCTFPGKKQAKEWRARFWRCQFSDLVCREASQTDLQTTVLEWAAEQKHDIWSWHPSWLKGVTSVEPEYNCIYFLIWEFWRTAKELSCEFSEGSWGGKLLLLHFAVGSTEVLLSQGDTHEVFGRVWGSRSDDIFSLVDFNAITMFSCFPAGNFTFLVKIRPSWLMQLYI